MITTFSIIALLISITGSCLSIYIDNIHYNIVNIVAALLFLIVILLKKNKPKCPLSPIPISIALIKDVYYWTATSASSLKYMATSIMIADISRLVSNIAIVLIWWLYVIGFISSKKTFAYLEYALMLLKVILYVLPIIFYNNQCNAEYYMNMISYIGILVACTMMIYKDLKEY